MDWIKNGFFIREAEARREERGKEKKKKKKRGFWRWRVREKLDERGLWREDRIASLSSPGRPIPSHLNRIFHKHLSLQPPTVQSKSPFSSLFLSLLLFPSLLSFYEMHRILNHRQPLFISSYVFLRSDSFSPFLCNRNRIRWFFIIEVKKEMDF